MRNLALSVAVIAGLFLPIGAIHAQSTETVTATCKDGTAFTGTKHAGACRGHGGVQSWGAAGAAATSPGAAPSQPAPVTSSCCCCCAVDLPRFRGEMRAWDQALWLLRHVVI
jgi:hypothetical protein